MEGFHAFEAASELRWTDGDALLPASLFEALTGAVQIELRLCGTTTYRLESDTTGYVAA